eukprot:gene13642-15069_t
MYCAQCGHNLGLHEDVFCCQCGSIVHKGEHEYQKFDGKFEFSTEKEAITYYFKRHFSNKTIVMFLQQYQGISISVRTLKRRLSEYGLSRNQHKNLADASIREIIEREIHGPSSLKGYRGMWNTLRCSYGIIIPRDRVMRLLKDVDPEGTSLCQARRLHRRVYTSPGPNTCWHIDGYDKLKPYGLPIHGCIDGFSRKILWLRVTRTNNNPLVTAFFFIQKLRELKCCPQIVQTDCGTENGIIAGIQSFLWQDEGAHRYGFSPSNQRIENWWSHMKKSFSSWVIDFFKNLVLEGILIPGNHIHMECVWFVFSDFLQTELDNVKFHWNTHHIRKSRHDTVGGIPDVLFFMPNATGHTDSKKELSEPEINNVTTQRNIEAEALPILNEHDEELFQFFQYVVNEEQLCFPPKTWDEAKQVFSRIIELC